MRLLQRKILQVEVEKILVVMGDVTIGKTYSNEYICGYIYCVRIYNRALSEEEIKHNYEIDKERFGI